MTSNAHERHSTFVGRATELARLDAVWQRARTGRTSLVVVDGEAGIGKTSLVRRFSRSASDAGARVLWGECIDLQDGALPYAPFRQALRGAGDDPGMRQLLARATDDLAELLTDSDREPVSGESRQQRRVRLFEALLRMLHELAATRPLLLVVEDVHWADHTSLDLLTFLSRNLGDIAALILLTHRPDLSQANRALQDFLLGRGRGTVTDRFALDALGVHEIAQQIADLTGEEPRAAVVSEIAERSNGNPLFVEELVKAERSGEGLPRNLVQLLLRRVEGLPEDVRELLRVAAVAGPAVAYDVLRSVADVPADELPDLLRHAVDADVLVEDPRIDGYAFTHALLQEAIYDSLLLDRRRTLHERYADALLAGRTGDLTPGAVARHWDRAGQPERALRAYVDAADLAKRSFAFVDVERFLRRASQLWEAVADPEAVTSLTKRHLANKTLEASIKIEEAEAAIDVARDALAMATAESDPRAVAFQHGQLAHALWYAGREDEALGESLRALELVDDEPSPEQARILTLRAGLLALDGRYSAARELAERALAVSVDAGAPRAYRIALATLGSVRARQGALEEGLRVIDDAEELARLRSDADEIMRIVLLRGRVLQAYGRWEQARRAYVAGLTEAPKYGMSQFYVWRLKVLAARMSFLQGRWDEARADVDSARAEVTGRQAALPSLMIASGELEEAAAFFSGPRSKWRSDGTGLLQVPDGPVELAVWQGRYTDARESCVHGLRMVGGSEERMPEARLCRAALRGEADCAERTDDEGVRAEAAEFAADLLARLQTLRGDRPPRADGFGRELAALASTGEAEMQRVLGRSDPDAWASVTELWETLDMPYPAAYARWQRARALRSRGLDPEHARSLRDDAYATAERLGAVPLRDAIRGIVPTARQGATRHASTRPTPTPTVSGQAYEQLTDRQREVVDLVIQGLTNRQIAEELGITEGTASVHVSNILRKLGVGSRTQAIALLLQQS